MIDSYWLETKGEKERYLLWGKIADATQLEVSAKKEPRFPKDKEDKSESVKDLILSASLKDWHTIVAHFLGTNYIHVHKHVQHIYVSYAVFILKFK